MAQKTSNIVVISIPAFSHQSSILELCKRLIDLNDKFHVTCIIPTIDEPIPATLRLVESLPSTIHCIFLPPITTQELLLLASQDDDVLLRIQLAVSQSMPSFRNTLTSLFSTKPLVALIADPFATQALEMAKEFNLLSYIYFPTSAMTASMHLHMQTLHQHIDPIQIPGCIPIHGHDLPDGFQQRYSTSLTYELNLQHAKRFSLADGFLVNSFTKMEEDTMRVLNHYKPTYLVGPIIQTDGSTSNNDDSNGLMCVEWLDMQRPNSVLYVSFGSLGTLSQRLNNELAFGLELSGQKFLWVLREPSDSPNDNNEDPLRFLPHGFLERTKGQGLVVPRWAPQTQILRHTSTGGFLTHCGWNSIFESIMEGVPMITWPLFAEQRMNAVFLTEGLKVALKIKFNEKNGTPEREEIAMVIRGLIVGEKRSGIQERIEVLKDVAAGTLREDGSSIVALSQFGIRMEEN